MKKINTKEGQTSCEPTEELDFDFFIMVHKTSISKYQLKKNGSIN